MKKTRIPRFATTVSVRLVLTLAGEDMTKSLKKPTKKAQIVPTAITLDPLSKAITMLGLSGNHEKFITLSMSIFL